MGLTRIWLLLSAVVLLSVMAAQCSPAEPQVVKVIETVIVKEGVDPNALPPQETLFYGGANSGAGDIPTLDPSLATDGSSLLLLNELFIGPIRLNEQTGAVEPGMATRWTVSADNLVYTFKLRDDVPWVKYNNVTGQIEQVLDEAGKPRLVIAPDFVYGIKRTLDPATASNYAYVNWVIKNAQAVNGGSALGEKDPLYGKLDEIGVRAVDDFTLEYTLSEPAAFFLSIAGMAINYAQPHWLIEEKGDRWIEAGVIHSYGPYTLKEWIHDVSSTIMANPFWPGGDSVPKPSIKYVHTKFLDESARFANYEAGLADVSVVPLPELDRVKADPTLNRELETPTILCTYYYGFNVAKPPFDDPNVRKAFSWAVDRTLLVENVTKGGQSPARWFSRPGLTAAPDPQAGDNFGPPVKADPVKAKQFLAASTKYPGVDKLPEIILMSNDDEGNIKIAEAIQQMWQENLGVKVNLVTQEWKVFLDTLETDPPQIWRNGWCQDYPDADNFDRGVFRSDSGNNYGKWSNPEFDKLVDQAARETDLAKRKELYLQAEKILVEEDAAIIPLYWYTQVEVTKPYVTRTIGMSGRNAFEKWQLNKPAQQ